MRFVTDTHCLLWHLQGDPRLSPASRRLFDEQTRPQQVVIPAIALAELLFVFRKYAPTVPFEKTLHLLEHEKRFEIFPLTAPIVREANTIHSLEMHDTLILATARHLDLPLLTVDRAMVESGVVQTLAP